MSEETSDTSCITNQATNPEEKSPQECPPSDVATADELFDSFMEIANNPEHHSQQANTQNGTTGEAVTVSETSESISPLKGSSADEQRDTASDGTHDQEESNASHRLSVSQLRDIFSSSSGELQTDTQNRIDDQGETIETDKKSATNGTPDQDESTVGDSSNVVVSQVKDVNSSAGEEKVDSAESVPATGELNSDDDSVQSATPDQGESTVEESSNPVVSQGKDVSSSDGAEKVDSAESVPATGELNSDDDPVQSATPDQGESTVEESSNPVVSQGKDVSSSAGAEKVDSTESVPATGELNSDGDPGQSATEVPTEGSEKVLPVSDESNSSELSATTNSEQSSSHVANGEDRTEELSSGTESLKTSLDSSETPVADNPDQTERDVDCAVSSDDQGEVSSGDDPTSSGKDVAKRLSEVMENLAGLEQQLSNAMTEMKRSNSEKTFAEKSVETEQKVEMQEGQRLENQPERQVADQTNITDAMETEVESKLSEEKVVTDKGCNVASVQQTDDNATVCKTDEDLNEVSVDSNNKETVEENTDRNDKGVVDDIHIDCKRTDADVVEAQEVKVENSESGELDIPVPANEDLKVERNITGTSETADGQVKAGQGADSKAADGTMESQTETNISEESKNDEEASSHKSDSMDELDKEVAKACMSIPDIEITTDESGISEKKSLDSRDTEGSSNSPPASPAFSDEGVDSDTPSDYGDDDDNGTFDADEASRRKSWLLEIDRDRLSSDSSTVSEKDFKENFDKGDNADGKPSKEDYIRGHLLKMGGTGLTPKNWRKRWFVLRGDNCLYYYKQSKDKVPCGVIILANYSVSKAPEINKNHCLKLTKGGARTYYMCAGSDSDMKKWIMAMMDAIKGSSGSSNPFNLLEGNVHNVSIPALSIRDPDCHGYLYKQGHNIKTWRRRYFVLKNGFLYYYSDMSNTVALGVAKLLNYTIQMGEQTGKKFCFSAVSSQPSSRTYYFAAESEMDRTRWTSRLEDSIRKGSLVC